MDLTQGCENVPIYMHEESSTDNLQNDFQYVPCSIPGPGIKPDDFEENATGCGCEIDCDNFEGRTCPCVKYGLLYTTDGCVKNEATCSGNLAVIQECTRHCSCSQTCVNRVVQHGIKVKMEVFEDSRKGFCVRVLEGVKRGQFLCEYAGEICSETEARKIATSLNDSDKNYLFVLKEHLASGVSCTYIYPRYRGNIGRFISHSCEPNLSLVPVRIANNIPHVCLFASHDLHAGQEVTYDYGDGVGNSHLDLSKTVCHCNSSNCRGFLPGHLFAF